MLPLNKTLQRWQSEPRLEPAAAAFCRGRGQQEQEQSAAVALGKWASALRCSSMLCFQHRALRGYVGVSDEYIRVPETLFRASATLHYGASITKADSSSDALRGAAISTCVFALQRPQFFRTNTFKILRRKLIQPLNKPDITHPTQPRMLRANKFS